MASLRILSRRGDDCFVWDRTRVALEDPEALAAVHAAEQLFADQHARGATAFKLTPGRPPELIGAFDRTAEQTVLVPRVVGG